MHKAKLKDIEQIRFPKNIKIDSLTQGDKIEYIYAARKIYSGHVSILEIDFFSFQEQKTVFRVFISKNDFITQSFSSTEPKWLTSQLYRLLSIYHYETGKWGKAAPLNERSKKTILSYLRPKLKGDEEHFNFESPLLTVRYFQEKIRKSQLDKKHQKIKDLIDSNFTKMDKLPRNINKWIEKYPLWRKQYIFYKREGKYYCGYCSACNSEVWPDYAKHLQPGVCPSCGSPVTFKAKGRSKNTRDSFVFSYIQKSADGGLIQRVYEGFKSYKDGFENPAVRFYEHRRYIYKDGNYEAFHHGKFKSANEYRWCQGFPRRQMGFYTFSDCGSLYFPNLRNVLQSTEWMDCRLDMFADTKEQFDPMDYLRLYYKQPEIRFLAENGLNHLILEAINKQSFVSPDINIKPEVFKTVKEHKSFLPMFREIEILANELELISSFPSAKFIKKDILLRIREAHIAGEFTPVLRYTTPEKALNYLEKQNGGKKEMKYVLIQWLDYLRFAGFLDYDMDSSFIVFPSKLKREHDRVSDEYGNIAELQSNEKIAMMSEKVNAMFAYENAKFLIRAPRDGKEIKDEGSALRHCVGAYVEDMAKLKTFILLLRDKDDIEKPFYTVEFKEDKVRQCHGYAHKCAAPEVSAFLDEWKAQLYRKEEQKKLTVAA